MKAVLDLRPCRHNEFQPSAFEIWRGANLQLMCLLRSENIAYRISRADVKNAPAMNNFWWCRKLCPQKQKWPGICSRDLQARTPSPARICRGCFFVSCLSPCPNPQSRWASMELLRPFWMSESQEMWKHHLSIVRTHANHTTVVNFMPQKTKVKR